MAYHLACELPSTFAAIAPVAATLSDSDCDPTDRVAVLHIHGTNDQNVPLEGGIGLKSRGRNDWAPVLDGISLWREANRCSPEQPDQTQNGAVTCYGFSGCAAGGDVEYCLIDGGGHSWPGKRSKKDVGSSAPSSMNASERIWDFFRSQTAPPD